MAQWSNTDEANSAPNYVVDATTGRTGIQEYGNTVFGQSPAGVEVGAGSPGWNRVVKGSGKVKSIVIVDGGIDYANTDVITVGSDTGTITTDGSGTILAVDIDFSGAAIDEVPEVEIDSENGAGAEFQVITEGKLGRVFVETLVAMRSIA